MKPPPAREGEGGGGKVASTGRLLLTPNAPLNQVSTLPPEILLEWAAELSRRLDRATALIALGLPDPGFDLLTEEVHQFKCKSCLAYAAAPRSCCGMSTFGR